MSAPTLASTQEVRQHTKYHDFVNKLEAELYKVGTHKFDIEHNFAGGIYSRLIHIPAGMALTSYVHKHEGFFAVLRGELNIITEKEIYTIGAGFHGKTKAGTRRVGYAVTDCDFISYHATDIMPEEQTEKGYQKAVDLVEKEQFEMYDNPLLKQLLTEDSHSQQSIDK
jgi:hypothetical protein